MPFFRTMQPSFAAGELSPALWARTDLAKYQTGLRLAKNVFIHPHGGASNRPGTLWAGETKYPNKKSRLIPFMYSTEQAYVLEFGDKYINLIALYEYKHLIIKDKKKRGLYDDDITEGVFKLLTNKGAKEKNGKEYFTGDIEEFVKILRLCNYVPTGREKRSEKYKIIKPFIDSETANNRIESADDAIAEQIGEGLNLTNPDDQATYITRAVAAINAGNSSKILRNECIKNIMQLSSIGILTDSDTDAILNLL